MLSAVFGNFKQHSAPGEVCVNGLSDRGSIPLSVTRHYHVQYKITKKPLSEALLARWLIYLLWLGDSR